MKVNAKILNIKYCLLLAAYWGIICVICGGYASVFLLAKDFSTTSIGIILAVANTLGALLQPFLASLVDSSEKVSLHGLTSLIMGIVLLSFIGLLFTDNKLLITGGLFILCFSLIQVVQSLSNSVSMYYINKGIDINFGVARGIGSIFYAALSSILGILTEKYNINVLLYTGILLVLFFIVTLLSMPTLKEIQNQKVKQKQKVGQNQEALSASSPFYFFRKYKGFLVVLLATFFIFIFHNLCNTYMISIVEKVGGGTKELGISLSVAAAVELPVMACFFLLMKKLKSLTILKISAVFFVIKALGYLLVTNIIQLYIVQALQIGAYAIFIPASVYYVNDLMEASDTVKGQALMVSSMSLAGVFASLTGGIVIDKLGVYAMLILQLICATIGLVFLFFFSKPKKNQDENLGI